MASRRDYTKVASIIQAERSLILKSHKTLDPTIAVAASSRRIAQNLAEMFEADNPTFDKTRFLKACGL